MKPFDGFGLTPQAFVAIVALACNPGLGMAEGGPGTVMEGRAGYAAMVLFGTEGGVSNGIHLSLHVRPVDTADFLVLGAYLETAGGAATGDPMLAGGSLYVRPKLGEKMDVYTGVDLGLTRQASSSGARGSGTDGHVAIVGGMSLQARGQVGVFVQGKYVMVPGRNRRDLACAVGLGFPFKL